MGDLHDNVGLALFFALGFSVCFLGSSLFVSSNMEHHQVIIDKGCAQYNSKTGEFEWVKR